MSNYFNDSPIERREEDLYGVTSFSEALAKSILNIKDPIGTTIALNGAWGSGKSSTVNLIRAELSEAKDSHLIVTEFKCWWYRGEEALALAFLQQLNSVLGEQFGDKTRKLVRKLGRGILQAGPVIGPAIALTPVGWLSGLVGGLFDVAKRLFPDEEPLETVFRELSKVLEAENRRFLVIIDDMDRLSSEEALAIFRLIKSVGRLPNVMYLVVFDRQLADKAINEKYPSEGPHFLEKIIQAGFELPMPVSTDLNNAVLASIDEICGAPSEDQLVRFMNVFYDVVAPYISDLTKDKLHKGLQTGINLKDAKVEGWPYELSLMCLRGDPEQLSNTVREDVFLSAVQDSLLWRNLEDKNPPAKVIRAALAKAPLMPDISSSILHMWQALENIIRIQSEITYRTSLLLAELCAPIQPRSLTYDTAKKSYGDRSKIAHGSSSSVDIFQWMRAWGLLQKTCQAILLRGGIPSADELTRELLAH
ncbi:P-loop NTPase fold protein [Pseudomonas sp. HMSC066A08]|uniref:P-loop NTPase fold protein n=1 Tax=Pseudomonas sp. HMSC066A08 TaxID=1739390 RepID=UPI0021145D57|nr:P-loop NTPase fold protein [Pseudomonas sp. HMSC066A08]